jgi:hypothetical protein
VGGWRSERLGTRGYQPGGLPRCSNLRRGHRGAATRGAANRGAATRGAATRGATACGATAVAGRFGVAAGLA